MGCWFYSFWRNFDLVKEVRFAVSGHFLKNAFEEWPEILHADVSLSPSELIILVTICWFSLFWWHFDISKSDRFEVSRHFLENAREEQHEIWHVDESWPASELISFWSRSVDFPNFCHVCSMAPCLPVSPLAAKGCRSYFIYLWTPPGMSK